MISNQIIQTSIDELRTITKVDLFIFDLDGMKVAATSEEMGISRDIIVGFASSPADSQVVGGYHFLKILDDGEVAYVLAARGMHDDVYMIARIAVSQIQNLIIAYKERFDRNNFFQNLILDNLRVHHGKFLDDFSVRTGRFYQIVLSAKQQSRLKSR